MKLHNTLTITFITLILISFYSYAEDISGKITACNTAVNNNDATAALKLADEILKREVTNRDALLCKGRALGVQGNYNEALSTLEKAEKESKDNFDQIITNILIGNLHKQNQKNTEAIASYEKSLKICEVTTNEKFARINHNLIGDTHTQNNDLNAALTSYLAGSKLANNDNERADSFERLAATYKALNQYDSAIEYQLKSVQMQRIAGTLDDFANASLELGRIYTLAKDYPNAEKTLNKLVQFSKDNGGAYYEAKANLYLAQSKAASGDASGAKALIADARNTAKSIGATDLTSEIDAAEKKLNN